MTTLVEHEPGLGIPKSDIRNPKSRRGVTLMEVLIAMFVMALGLLSVLALFPLGAKQMADAVKDERTLQTALIVEENARIFWRNLYPTNATLDSDPSVAFAAEPALQAFDNPDPAYETMGPVPMIIQSRTLLSLGSSEASFPVYFDGIGRQYQSGAFQLWVGGQTGILPRRSIAQLNPLINATLTRAQIIAGTTRLFSLMDDMYFTAEGTATNPISRDYRYNADFMLQRAVNSIPGQANLTVIVYRNRPVSDTPNIETSFTHTYTPSVGSTLVSFSSAGLTAPPIKTGGWILLAGQTNNSTTQMNTTHPVYPYADFYRVVSVQVNTSASTYTLEVSPPLVDRRPPQQYQDTMNQNGYYSTAGNSAHYIMVLDNVAEVFQRPVLVPQN
jgi:prepilin-type N-terminal cleavage/methylation domain-containing protein